MTINNISYGNKALEFIRDRIKDNRYRGSRSSQHNRYDMQQIFAILDLLDKYAPSQCLMAIRTTDISKRPQNAPTEFIYAKFCNDAKKKAGIGTQDAMRKNLFVDIHRMGLIERYDQDKTPIDPFSRRPVKYVSITKQGLRLIKAKTIVDRYFIFSKAIDLLLGGYIDVVLKILREPEYGMDKISIYEYMFFVSAIGTNTDFNITTNQAVDLIKEYRQLTFIQRRSVINTLKLQLNPKIFKGSKTNKRDFSNWHNKVAQIYHLLNQTVYFEVRGDQLVLAATKHGKQDTRMCANRSLNEKYQYFKNHAVKKSIGFELHHIVPLAWAENIHHFKMLDKWKNMVYIDAFSHAKITQNRHRHIVLIINNNDDIKLSDYTDNEVYLKYGYNIRYKPEYKMTMQQYNVDLLNTIE
jgi:hypothetical protein